MINSTISVIITNFNRTDTVKDAVESVFRQSYNNIEIIVVDDCSEVSAKKYLRCYLPRINIIQSLQNKGVSASRNIGAKHSKGEYIAFLDSDDIWLKDKLKSQLDDMKKHDALIGHTDEFWYRDNRYVNCGKRHERYGGYIFPFILDKCRVSPSSFVIEKDLFLKSGGFNEKLRVCEDYELFIKLAANYKFSYLNCKLTVKRALFKNSLSSTIKHIESVRLDILKSLKESFHFNSEQLFLIEKEIARKQKIVHDRT